MAATGPQTALSVGTGAVQRTLRGFTRWALVAAGLVGALEGLAWLTGALWLHVLAVLVFASFAAACIDDPRVGDLQVVMEAPLQATVGDRVPHRFTVLNAGRRHSFSCHLRSHAHGYDDVSVLLPALPPGARIEVEVPRVATTRGYAAGSVIALSSAAPLGIRWVTGLATIAAPLVVRPRLTRAGRLDLDTGSSSVDLGSSVVRRDGDQLHGVRDWRSGDDARLIHWRTTARRGSLAVVEHESVQQPRVVLVAVGPASDPSFEESVSTLATTAVEALQRGASLALLANQDGLLDLLDATRDSALDWTAALGDVRPADTDVLVRAARAAGPGGAVYVCGPGAQLTAREAAAAARTYGVRLEVLRSAS